VTIEHAIARGQAARDEGGKQADVHRWRLDHAACRQRGRPRDDRRHAHAALSGMFSAAQPRRCPEPRAVAGEDEHVSARLRC
jgi:hypothetical protein